MQNNFYFPFQKFEIDLANANNEKQINISGNLLIIANGIIPIGVNTADDQVISPALKLNSKSSQNILIEPYTILRSN